MGWLRNIFKKKVPYVPQGRVGYRRIDTTAYYCVIIVEEVGRIGNRSKIKVLEVSMDRDTVKTKQQCLRRWGQSDWVPTGHISWESTEQKNIRLGGDNTYNVPQTIEVNEFRQPSNRNLTPHTFN